MKSEQVTKVWECYRDYNYTTFREPVREQFRELDDYVYGLEAENAELRKAMDFQALELGCMTDNRDVLYVENKNLRELIADTLLDPREYCEKYGIEYKGWDSANAHIDKRMRELGVLDE